MSARRGWLFWIRDYLGLPEPTPPGTSGKSEERPSYFVLGFLALAFLLLSEGLSRNGVPLILQHEAYADIVKELGYALIISIVISMTVEVAARRAQQRDINAYIAQTNQNVFGGVFGIFLPPAVVREFVDLIVNAPFLRTRHEVTLTLRRYTLPVPGGPVIFKIAVQFSYTVKNTTPAEVVYEIPLRIDHAARYQGWPDDCLDSLFVDGVAVPNLAVAPTGGLAPLHQVTLATNQQIEVVINSVCYRELSDSEAIFTVAPCLDVRARLIFDAAVADDKCGAMALAKAAIRRQPPSRDGCTHEWRMVAPTLPYQAIYLWWRCQ